MKLSVIPFYKPLALVCFILVQSTSWAGSDDLHIEDLHIERLSISDELKSLDIRDLYQDSYGFIWIATDEGLAKYDGYGLKRYRFKPFDSTSITANAVNNIFEDSFGDLWIGTVHGLGRMSRDGRENDRFEQYYSNADLAGTISDNGITAIFESRDGSIWVGTDQGGLNRYNRLTNTFTNYAQKIQLSFYLNRNPIWVIREDAAGNLLIGTEVGLLKLNPQTNDYTIHFPFSQKYLPLYKRYTTKTTTRLDSLMDNIQPLASINRVGNLADERISFTLAEGCSILVFAMGEGIADPLVDIGWLEHAGTGNKVWKMQMAKTGHAGGHFKNRIQVDVISLEPGTYTLRYKTDDSHAYNAWNTRLIPEKPESWGLQIFSINEEDAKDIQTGINEFTQPTSIINAKIRTIEIERRENSESVWIGTEDGLDLFDSETNSHRHFTMSPTESTNRKCNHITNIVSTLQRQIWIGTKHGGLQRMDTDSFDVNAFALDSLQPSIPDNIHVRVVMADKNGNLWIGSRTGDIHRISLAKFKKPARKLQNLLTGKTVNSFYEDNQGILWVATSNGLIRYYRIHATASLFFHDEQDPNSISSNYISFIQPVTGDETNLWIGTNTGLNKLILKDIMVLGDEATARFERIQLPANGTEPGNVAGLACMLQTREGIIWLGTFSDGVIKYNPKNHELVRYTFSPNDKKSLQSNSINHIHEDKNGKIWIATVLGGLSRYDQDSNNFTTFLYDPHNEVGINNNTINFIHESMVAGEQVIWLGTYSGGLARMAFDVDGQEVFSHFTTNDGLPNNKIKGLVEDGDGNLWISTNDGLAVFSPQSNSFVNYNVRDGLMNAQFRSRACYQSRRGEIFFGGSNGFNHFFPDNIPRQRRAGQTVITQFRIKNRPTIFDLRPENTEPFFLSYAENYFGFDFVSLNYGNSENAKYVYKLEGADDDWLQVGQNRSASYNNVPPGEYTFRVSAVYSNADWENTAAAISFVIKPPWWQTTVFRILAGVCFFLSFYLAYRFRVGILKVRQKKLETTVAEQTSDLRRQKRELETQKREAVQAKQIVEAQKHQLLELDQAKSHFFANVSHEFRTPLTMILGPLDDMIGNGYDAKTKMTFQSMRRNAQRLLRLINQVLDLSRLESGKMELKLSEGDLIGFVKGILFSFGSLAEKNGIQLSFKSEPKSLTCRFDRDMVEKIIYNLVSNAIKLTEKGEVSVKVSGLSGDRVKINVVDTGRGIEEKHLDKIFNRFYQADSSSTRHHEGTGIGLALTKELVELHSGTIEVESGFEKGTEFTVYLKIWSRRGTPDNSISEQVISPSPAIEDDSRPIILIVEDNAEVSDYISQHLEKEYQVVTAVDGKDGVDKALNLIPDLVLSDVMMPKIGGYELCSILKTDEKTCHIPIVLLTAKAANESKIAGLETGADDYLTKPFNSAELLVRIKNLIAQRRLLREKFSKQIMLEPQSIEVSSLDEVISEETHRTCGNKY